jgi:diguanylate cyclase (GGDEF)-like protein
MGEGIAGSVLSEGRPWVTTIEALGKQSLPERRYKTNSFISYPIAIGPRKIGVLNLTDKIGGGSYDSSDLNMIDLVAPQIALALERAAWQHRANQFQLMSITDPLTGLHNRRYLEARLSEELNRSKRYDHPMSFMMIDIDDFKLYNDRNGHQAGDRALEITAQCLRSTLRKVDVASRYGGEEFSILLPQTTLEEAGAIADRLRRKIMSTRFPQGDSQPLGAVTVSIGLSSYSPSLDSVEAIVRAADRALYHAKSHGKNRAYAYQGASK